MSKAVDQILDHRREQVTRVQRLRFLAMSAGVHALIVASVWLVPTLFAADVKPLPPFVPVIVVPPSALGTQKPPPPPPSPRPEPEKPEPKVEKPPPKPPPEDVPVLKTKKKAAKKPPVKSPVKLPRRAEPPPNPTPEPATNAKTTDSTQRRGTPTGDPLGASTKVARVGVEDPNFTYGYYLNRVVGSISEHWNRPPIGGGREVMLNFRIQADGRVTELKLVSTSGSDVFDQAAMRAVNAASPLPPLPRGYKRDNLGINVIVR